MLKLALIAAVASVVAAEYQNEFVIMPGHTRRVWNDLPMPVEYIKPSDLPAAWDWSNINGTSYITKSLNQHIPQYCGSCWAHGALSALADRVKIARKAQGQDINLSIQYILNCAGDVAGSCHGGSPSGVYQFVKETGFVPYDTCMNYEACSRESNEGRCRGGNWECSAINTCRTCNTFTSSGGQCREIVRFPNVTVSNYGDVPNSVDALKAEIFARGPVACGVNATPLVQYTGGVYDDRFGGRGINHIVSIVGWGVDSVSGKEFWRVRNSWGEFWGELGFFRIATGNNQLGIEEMCSWATPGSWTEHNYPCYEDGTNCVKTAHYVDPAVKVLAERARSLISALQP